MAYINYDTLTPYALSIYSLHPAAISAQELLIDSYSHRASASFLEDSRWIIKMKLTFACLSLQEGRGRCALLWRVNFKLSQLPT